MKVEDVTVEQSKRYEELNYYGTFIQVAPDTRTEVSKVPQLRGGKKTVAVIQYELISENPYKFKQADVLFEAYLRHKQISEADRAEHYDLFFGKPQACMRASALPKSFGWGVDFDADGRVALIALDSAEYQALANDPNIKQLYAMRNKRQKKS